ncbi:hypothetical protein ACFVAJ_16500 [Agromyces sp. NPDC057679]|uniref:hypothetical protein n=1 Tax=Agromyces sp. NPDC057679 TaxID=3346207 RepID=UPI00366CD954
MNPRRTSGTRNVDAGEVKVRIADAKKGLEVAELYIEETDPASWKASGSNAVTAGIAAADAICGHVLGYTSSGQNHLEAIAVLNEATSSAKKPATNLRRLLDQKTDYQYGTSVMKQDSARKLVDSARELVAYAEQVLRS